MKMKKIKRKRKIRTGKRSKDIQGYTPSGDPIFAKLKLAIEFFTFPHPSRLARKNVKRKEKKRNYDI